MRLTLCRLAAAGGDNGLVQKNVNSSKLREIRARLMESAMRMYDDHCSYHDRIQRMKMRELSPTAIIQRMGDDIKGRVKKDESWFYISPTEFVEYVDKASVDAREAMEPVEKVMDDLLKIQKEGVVNHRRRYKLSGH
eukprot:GEMP01091626.1.p1 GENE.GEMP01091626.1~~GEMP01091626.1.p1  ORF type:complete len:137 (+),score=20.59 GEMP01091626.1:33-443(+)